MNIIFYGGHYWDKGPWFRKQQFAKRLSDEGHRVLYIEKSVSIIRKRKNDKNKILKSEVKKENNNLYIIIPSVLFPKPGNYYSRYLYNLKLLYDINKLLGKLNIDNYIFWFNKLHFSSVLKYIKARKIIFDLCDDLPFYSKLANDENGYKTQMRYLKQALYYADIPIVSAAKLKEKYQRYTCNEIILVPNGHNIRRNKKRSGGIPKDIKIIKKPIIGFIGTLFRFIDDELLEYIIKERPQYSYVFIGKKENNFPVEKIAKYHNVHLLSEKKMEEMPGYIGSFDICINPFKNHEVNDSVMPVKVFEYLAMNKNIVSTYMYSLMKEGISKDIYFAKTKQDFLEIIDNLIKEKIFINKIDSEVIDEYHWDNIFNKLIQRISDFYHITL